MAGSPSQSGGEMKLTARELIEKHNDFYERWEKINGVNSYNGFCEWFALLIKANSKAEKK